MAKPENQPSPSDSPEGKPPPSVYEFLHGGITEDQRRVLRKFLKEWAGGDENSFPFQLSLLTLSQWRAAASVPVEVDRILSKHRDTAQDAAKLIANAAKEKLTDFTNARTDFLATTVQLKGLTEHLDKVAKDAEARLNKLAEDSNTMLTAVSSHMESDFTRRRNSVWKWALVISALLTMMAVGAVCAWQHQARAMWQANAETKMTQERAQTKAKWQDWAQTRIADRLEKVAPPIYRLAQQISETSRPVRLPDGTTAWEALVFNEGGIIRTETIYNPENLRAGCRIILLKNPMTMGVKSTSPPAKPAEGNGANP